MKPNKQFFQNIFVQERAWSGRLFLCLVGIYLISILVIALPDGMSTRLAEYSVSNPDCTQTTTQENVTKNCNPTQWLTAGSTVDEYLFFFGYGDPSSYVRAALLLNGMEASGVPHAEASYIANLSMVGRLKQVNAIGFGMWPPGMFFLNALPLKISPEIPLGLYQVFVTSVLWAIAFAIIASLLAVRMRLLPAVALPFLMMPLQLFHDYFFHYGVVYSETYAAALMMTGFSLLFQVVYRKPNSILMFIAGLCFAVASLLRAQAYPVAIGVSVILIGYYCIQKWNFTYKNFAAKCHVKFLVIGAFLFGFYLPIGGYLGINNGVLFNAEYAWEYPFKIPAFPNAGAANFAALGGTRAACEVDIKKCEEIQSRIKAGGISYEDTRTEVIKAFICHPISFSAYKLPIAWRYWFAGTDNQYPQDTNYRADNIFILIVSLISLLYMAVQRLWLLFWSSISTCALLFAPPFFLHFEGRYFYLMKAFFLFSPLWLLAIGNANIKKVMPSVVNGRASSSA